VAKVTTTTLTSGAHIGCSSTHWDDTYFNDRRRHSITPYPTAERAEAQQTIARNIEPEAASAPTAGAMERVDRLRRGFFSSQLSRFGWRISLTLFCLALAILLVALLAAKIARRNSATAKRKPALRRSQPRRKRKGADRSCSALACAATARRRATERFMRTLSLAKMPPGPLSPLP
jgi:hypothetical protein